MTHKALLQPDIIARIGTFLDFESRMNSILAHKDIFKSIHYYNKFIHIKLTKPHHFLNNYLQTTLESQLNYKPLAENLIVSINCNSLDFSNLSKVQLSKEFKYIKIDLDAIRNTDDIEKSLEFFKDLLYKSAIGVILGPYDIPAYFKFQNLKDALEIHTIVDLKNLHVLTGIEHKVTYIEIYTHNKDINNIIIVDLGKFMNARFIEIKIETLYMYNSVLDANNIRFENLQYMTFFSICIHFCAFKSEFFDYFTSWFNVDTLSASLTKIHIRINHEYRQLYLYVMDLLLALEKKYQNEIKLELTNVGRDLRTVYDICKVYCSHNNKFRRVELKHRDQSSYIECMMCKKFLHCLNIEIYVVNEENCPESYEIEEGYCGSDLIGG